MKASAKNGQPDCGGDLDDQNRGHTDNKVPVSGFVMKHIHACERPYRTAQKGSKEQSLFRNPPELFLCFSFVRRHHGEAENIDKNQVDKDNFCKH